jgi:ribA/ribD-fused uncharacterized protein
MNNTPVSDSRFIEDVRARFNAGEALDCIYFWGHRPGKNKLTVSCFSQWYVAPFIVDGVRYLTAEHFMMAEKAALFDDAKTRGKVIAAATPAEAKSLGRQVAGFNDARWVEKRYSIVVRANAEKFRQNAELGEFLKQSAPRVLVEASPVDKVWGIGMAKEDNEIGDPNRWRGLNLLGFALMQVRDGL